METLKKNWDLFTQWCFRTWITFIFKERCVTIKPLHSLPYKYFFFNGKQHLLHLGKGEFLIVEK